MANGYTNIEDVLSIATVIRMPQILLAISVLDKNQMMIADALLVTSEPNAHCKKKPLKHEFGTYFNLTSWCWTQ